jgi:hypothetical protein
LSFLYILYISPLSDVGLVKTFSQSAGFYFVLLTVSFILQKLHNFMRSICLLFILELESLVFCSRNLSVSQCVEDVFYFLFYQIPCIWFYVEFLDPLGLELYPRRENESICILLNIDCKLDQYHLLKILSFFPLYDFDFFVNEQGTIGV